MIKKTEANLLVIEDSLKKKSCLDSDEMSFKRRQSREKLNLLMKEMDLIESYDQPWQPSSSASNDSWEEWDDPVFRQKKGVGGVSWAFIRHQAFLILTIIIAIGVGVEKMNTNSRSEGEEIGVKVGFWYKKAKEVYAGVQKEVLAFGHCQGTTRSSDLFIDNVFLEEDDPQTIFLTGTLNNSTNRTQEVPALRVELQDKAGNKWFDQTIKPSASWIEIEALKPGQVHDFEMKLDFKGLSIPKEWGTYHVKLVSKELNDCGDKGKDKKH